MADNFDPGDPRNNPLRQTPPASTTPRMYTTGGSIAGTVFTSRSGLSDPDAVRGNSVEMARGRGGIGDAPWNFAEFMENFIATFGYNPFMGTGVGVSEGDIPNVDQLNPDDVWQNLDPTIKQFMIILSKYLEGLDSDDMDRVARQEEANRWLDMYNKYKNDEISLEELRAFEPVELAGMPGWDDYFQGIVGGGDGGEQPDEFQGLYDKYGKDIVDDAREKYDEVVKVLGEAAEDPFGAIENLINTVSSGTAECREANVPDWIRNCVTVGVLYGIPGLPLPPIPGVMGTTIGELEEGFKNIGRSVQDILDGAETCGEEGDELCTWEDAFGSLKDWIIEKANNAIDDITLILESSGSYPMPSSASLTGFLYTA